MGYEKICKAADVLTITANAHGSMMITTKTGEVFYTGSALHFDDEGKVYETDDYIDEKVNPYIDPNFLDNKIA